MILMKLMIFYSCKGNFVFTKCFLLRNNFVQKNYFNKLKVLYGFIIVDLLLQTLHVDWFCYLHGSRILSNTILSLVDPCSSRTNSLYETLQADNLHFEYILQ